MKNAHVKISRISQKISSISDGQYYSVCWIKDGVSSIEINQTKFIDISNSIFFLQPNYNWTITNECVENSSGYVLYLPKSILENPTFKNLHITEVRLFGDSEIPKITLAPGIEKRVQSIVEMIDELVSTNLKNREDAILALLHTFFVYCDGKCNIKTTITDNNSKSVLVYKFKRLIDKRICSHHRISDYADMLHISDKYLNECVKDVLGVNAKHLIDEQLIMRSRHQLKFSDLVIKEIAFSLGFSSPDYFSSFVKKHTGITPTQLRRE